MSDTPAEIDPDALPPGTRLAEFEIERVLGIGGFGIVYLAFDHALERRVALKEYMPATLAARRGGTQIAPRSEAHAKTFGIGLRSFVNESRLLARFDHPALVKVYRFWEDNGTAYMAMPYYLGRTLGSVRAEMGSPPNEAWLLTLADALLGALEALHRQQVFHRDVAPDNILLQPGGSAVLLDFGAARHVIADQAQSLTAILKPNFAPIEQYADSARLRQGPWSDVYSLGAVLYFCLIGRAPSPSATRVVHDELPSLLALRQELVAADGSHYSVALLSAIDASLQVRPDARPQHAAAFRAALRGEPPEDLAAPPLATAPLAEAVGAIDLTPERAAFAPTLALQRVLAEVTTSWATLGPELAPSSRATARRNAGATSQTIPPPRWRRWVALGLLPFVGLGWLGYGLSQPDTPRETASAAPFQTPDRVIASPAALPNTAATATPTPALAPAKPAASAAAAKAEPRNRPVQSAAVVATAKPLPEREPVRATAALAPLSVRQACGDRNFISKAFCMQRQCGKPAFAQAAECVELRQQEERNRPPLF